VKGNLKVNNFVSKEIFDTSNHESRIALISYSTVRTLRTVSVNIRVKRGKSRVRY